MKKFSTISRNDDFSKEVEKKIQERIKKENWMVDEDDPEFVFVIGGDGTFLLAVHKYLNQLEKINFIGIHTGTLGFFTDYQSAELNQLFSDVIHQKPQIQEYRMLECEVDNRKIYSLNEMRVENVHKTQIMDVYLNDALLERFRGTGLCVCTQLGSTAYNRSLNGAVIQSGLEVLELCEITGIHHREFRSLGSPLILCSDTQVTFCSSNYDGAVLCWDQYSMNLKGDKKIIISLSDKKVKIARYRPYDYTAHLKNLF